MHSNAAVIISAIHILCAAGMITVAASVIRQDSKSITRRVYFAELTVMAIWSLFNGLMIVSNDLDFVRFYWTISFFSSVLFFPVWLHVQLSWADVGTRFIKKLIYLLGTISVVLSIACIWYGKVTFKVTDLGVHFSYQGSLIFQITILYSSVLLLMSAFYNLKWLLSTKFRRERQTAIVFFILMLTIAPIAFITDFFIPTFLGYTTILLSCPIVMILTIPYQYSLKLNHIFNVSIQGVSELVFQSATMPILVLNHQNKIVATNKYAAECFSRNGKLVDTQVQQLFDTPDQDDFEGLLNESFENHAVNVVVGNETKNYDMQLVVMKDKYGEIYRKIVILKDVTEIQRTSTITKLQKEISIAVSSNSNFDEKLTVALGLIGEHLKIDRIAAFELKSGASEGDYFHCMLQWNAKDNVSMQTILPKVPMQHVQAEYEMLNKVGHVKYRDVTQGKTPFTTMLSQIGYKSFLAVPLMEQKKLLGVVIIGCVSTYRDWTPAETSLAQSIADIVVAALVREQLQNEIIAERDIASAANQAKSEFLSRMSHEIRTPMNAIIGMTTIAQTAEDPSKIAYCLSKISDASRHLLGIINDVLDMSKIEANKLELIEEPFDFEKTLENICNVVAVKADEKKINLSIHTSAGVPTDVIGDELRLSQVITNLLSNAIKFTPDHGSIKLNIDLKERLSENESLLYFEVVDTGIGISPEQQRKLFKSFEQAEGNITRRFGGTGLGLVISKRIVELMGGEIGVTSAMDQGSCFHFTIKIRHAKKADAIDTSMYKGKRILVVDDDPAVLNYFSRVLTKFGMVFDCASDGESAVALVQSSVPKNISYDIIFIDYLMEGLNGIETVREIRNIVGDSVNVIMISMTEWNTIEKEATQVGVADFISKPLFSSSILNAINKLVIDKRVMERAKEATTTDVLTFSRCRLLLVEDIEINREIAITLLEETRITIDCAENGQIAVDMFRDNQDMYDIILMDMQMPVMDGLEATRQIRAIGTAQAKEIPIIAMTANAFKEDVEACKAAGMNNHIGKPIDMDDMLSKITGCLKGKED